MNMIEPRANLAFRDRETTSSAEITDADLAMAGEDTIAIDRYPLKWMLMGLGLFCSLAWVVFAAVFALIF